MASAREDHKPPLDDSAQPPSDSDAEPSRRISRRAILGWIVVLSVVNIPLFRFLAKRVRRRESVLVEFDGVDGNIDTEGRSISSRDSSAQRTECSSFMSR